MLLNVPDNIPRLKLADLPTPVVECKGLADELGAGRLFIKRDDLSGGDYGGNKVRKLEFLLARAVQSGAKEVLTFGGAGSNHALATGIYAAKTGLRSISMLLPQPNSHHVRENLLLSQAFGIEMHQAKSVRLLAAATIGQLGIRLLKTGRIPMIIPAGGSSPLGTVGFVNAAFELRDQVEKGLCPEPDLVYVAFGSMGTTAGLMLGMKAAGMKAQVVPVRVVASTMSGGKNLAALFKRTNILLHDTDRSFPICRLSDDDLKIRDEFFGGIYGRFTKESVEAVKTVYQTTGIRLESVYTGKTIAGLIHDARSGALKNRTVLFWNTFNSRDLSDTASKIDFHNLPSSFHKYFTEDVQELDRK